MEPTNPRSRESEEPASRQFWGTIDQLIGYNLAWLRSKAGISQGDIATIVERITGREHSRNWLSLRETGQQPFTVAELIILASIFKVPVMRLLRIDYDKYDVGTIYVDGLGRSIQRFNDDFFLQPERPAADISEIDDPLDLYAQGQDLKALAETLQATRDSWFPQTEESMKNSELKFRDLHEPHERAGKGYKAWKKRRAEQRAHEEELIRQVTSEREARRGNDGDDQED
jgi:transcriptional regulator with XRE-family HTH domain